MTPESGWSGGREPAVEVLDTIVCVDCGGPARLLTTWDEENPPRPGDLAVYRCVDCLDRWDVVLPGGEEAEP